MKKREFQLSEKEIKEFKSQESQSKRVDELKRLQAVRLYGSGHALRIISEMLSCAEQSVRIWVLEYRRKGIEGLLSHYANSAQNARLLSREEEADLAQKLRDYRPKAVLAPENYRGEGGFWTVESLKAVVSKWYGLSYGTHASYRNLFHRCGFSYQKTAGIYKSRPSAAVIDDFEAEFEKK